MDGYAVRWSDLDGERPKPLRMVFEVSRAVALPLCGIGGIASAEDALAFLLCGATAVQIGTQSYTHPGVALEIRDGLIAYCQRQGVARIQDLVGALEI